MAGLYLGIDAKLDTTVYPTLSFAIRPMEDNLAVGVVIWASNKKASTMVYLHKLEDFPKKGVWKRYTLPVSSFTPSEAKIGGLAFQTFQQGAAPLYFVDSVCFLKGAGSGAAPTKPEPP